MVTAGSGHVPRSPGAGAHYIRFVCAQPHPVVEAELGMFAARDTIDFTACKGSVQRAHDEAWHWFAPSGVGLYWPRLSGRARTRDVRRSLFWFPADAAFFGHPRGSIVHRARQLATAITDAGVEIRELQTDDPGSIIWSDSHQVLALPTSAVPRAFDTPVARPGF